MSPADRLFQSFDRIYVLNLADRVDRRVEMAGELARIGTGYRDPRVRLFPAIRPDDPAGFPSIGARGCFLSHLALLREARDAGLEHILVLEDDCDFVRGIDARLPTVLDALDAERWAIFYGGYDLDSSPALRSGTELMLADPALPIRTTHMIGFGRAAIAGLVPFLEAMLDRPPGSAEGGPMHIDGAYGWFRRGRPDLD
jgi:glycosyl transferase, family 25